MTYTALELRRAFRNRRFLFFSLGFPLVLYFVIAAPQRAGDTLAGTGISVRLYFMASLASFGTMMSMISSGARIAGEREAGWTRQLRITPLSSRAYFRAKVLTSYAMALTSLALLYIAGASLGVGMPVARWFQMTGLMLLGLLPFAALGVLLGHLVTVDSVGPVTGGTVSLLALISGTWFPVTHGFLHDLGQFLPSYWLVQAGRVATFGHGWGTMGWAVVVAWTVLLAAGAGWAYRRDTRRV